MASKHGGNTQNSRPTLPTQQSSSVPSTPHQRPRRAFGTGSRSPSPRGLSGSHSPRSVVSEVHASTLPKGSPRCKYEGKKPLTRRRIQYNFGDALLDDPPNKPKESLDPDEDKKLSGDMRELYDRLLPTEDSESRRRLFVEKLERILCKEWPESEFKVHVFGSSGNLLCTNDSDVDICIQTNMIQLETMHILASTLDNSGMERVICVPAKVPIAKIWDPELKLAADLNVNNTLALENTRMIKTYVQIDERVRPLAMIIKHWTRQRILNDAGLGGTISSYAWICMILNFLQTRNPPILPSLHSRLLSNDDQDKDKYLFDDNLEKLQGFGKDNKQSIGELLLQFFRYYGYEFNYQESVVSVRAGRVLTRKEKGWTTTSKDGQWRLCIEEPFNTYRNLGNSADNTAFRGIHLEIRDAFTHLTNLKLNKLVEQYEFPPEEKSSVPIFKRAPGAPIPILPAQGSGRGKGRSNRHNRGNHSGPSSRRASSGSAYGKNSHAPFSPSPMGLGAEFFSPQLAQQWATMLSFQAGQLKAQMYNNQIAQSQLAAAASHAQSVVQGGGSQARELNHAALGNQRMFAGNMSPEQFMNGNNFFQPFMYSGSTDQGTTMTHSVSQDGSRTNPSSPSLGTAVPARRGMQRSSVSNGSPGASIRSQSQPARGIPQNLVLPYPMAYDPNTGLPLFATTGLESMPTYQTADNPSGYTAGPRAMYNPDDPAAKQYLGYFFENSPSQQIPPLRQPTQIPRTTSHTDLAQRREKGARDLQPLNLNGNKKSSRSPSPMGHQRHFSIPLRSAPLPSMVSSSRLGNSFAGTQPIDQIQSPTSGSISGTNPLNGLYLINDTFPSPPGSDRIGQYPPSTSDETPPAYFDPSEPVFSDDNSTRAYPGMYNMDFHHEMDSIDSQGGLYLQNVPADPNGVGSLGSPIQPFPVYTEPGMSPLPSLPSQEEEVVHSPTRQHQSIWQTFSPTAALSPTKDGKEKTPGSKSAPILSPVMETRTPSPNARRKIENFPPPIVNGNMVNGHVPNGIMSYRAPEPVPPTPLSMANVASFAGQAKPDANHGGRQHSHSVATGQPPPAASGQWSQQPSNRRRASRKRSKSGPATRSANDNQAHKGQPMPARVEERKGG